MRPAWRSVEKPADWDKVISAAYLRLQGRTQKDAASAVGCARTTLQYWEKSAFWTDALQEATTRWLGGLRAKAMTGLERSVKKDGRLALDVLGRIMPELAPNATRLDVSGELDLNLVVDNARQAIRSRVHRLREARQLEPGEP